MLAVISDDIEIVARDADGRNHLHQTLLKLFEIQAPRIVDVELLIDVVDFVQEVLLVLESHEALREAVDAPLELALVELDRLQPRLLVLGTRHCRHELVCVREVRGLS